MKRQGTEGKRRFKRQRTRQTRRLIAIFPATTTAEDIVNEGKVMRQIERLAIGLRERREQ